MVFGTMDAHGASRLRAESGGRGWSADAGPAPRRWNAYARARLTASVMARLANTRQRCDLYSTDP